MAKPKLDDIEEAKQRLETDEVDILESVLKRRATFIPDDLYKCSDFFTRKK